ncbi:MAG: hypothetical protein WCB04_10435 [Mycobacteriales bacterium]
MSAEPGAARIDQVLRFGWTLAEARGRNWFHGPRPTATAMPSTPKDALPLRSQRSTQAARRESVDTLVSLAHGIGFLDVDEFEAGLVKAIPSFDGIGEAALDKDAGAEGYLSWQGVAAFFFEWDGRIQDELTRRDERLTNAYLLGRGLAECYWGLGPEAEWSVDGSLTAVSPAFIFGSDRRRELTRMLGRLGSQLTYPLTAPAISGSLEAWGVVAVDKDWSRSPELRTQLYEQARRWYQLLVLSQDPTTLVRPNARLRSKRAFLRLLRAFWPQLSLATVAAGLIAAFFALTGGATPNWVSSLLATSGFGAIALATLIARGKNAAQRLVLRLRQDAYTDLVAVDVAVIPPYPSRRHRRATRRARSVVEAAVRRRSLTVPTPSSHAMS